MRELIALKKLKNGGDSKKIKEFIPTTGLILPKITEKAPATKKKLLSNTNPNTQNPYNQSQGGNPNQGYPNTGYDQIRYNNNMGMGGMYKVENVHEMFLKKQINIQQYEMMVQSALNFELQVESQRMLSEGSFNPNSLEVWRNEKMMQAMREFWSNCLRFYAKGMCIQKETLAGALDFLNFEQIDEIIQTYRQTSMKYIESNFIDDEKNNKLEQVDNFVNEINIFLNSRLDEIEGVNDYDEDYYQRDRNNRHYNRNGKQNKKKGGNKQKKPVQKKTAKPTRVKKRKGPTRIEEIVNIDQLVVKQKVDLEEQGERARLDVFDRSKEPLNIIFIGHVDCGKSTICGNILVMSGKVNELEIKRFQQEAKDKDRDSWFLAYIMDLNEEEREKGKTVEVGRATFQTKKKRFTILDCPGHEKYLINMLAGAAQADVAALVISAKPGEFESGFEKSGQTKQHAMLAKALGVQRLVIIVNKMDIVDWNKNRFDYIKDNLSIFLHNNCGYEEKDIFWTVISGLHGTNLKKRMDQSLAPWFYGQSLFETLDSLPKIKKTSRPFLRIPLLDKYKDQGNNMVFGKVESGVIKCDMKCVIMPIQKEITVQKIYNNDDKPMLYAEPGENVKLQIKGCELEEIKRGFVICGQQFWTNVAQEFIAEIQVLELLPSQIFNEGFSLVMHLHTIMEEVTVKKIRTRIDSEGVEIKDFRKKKIRKLQSRDKGTIILKTNLPICLEKYAEFSELGRFTLRKDNNTIAIGVITKYKPFDRDLLEYNNFFLYKKEEIELK